MRNYYIEENNVVVVTGTIDAAVLKLLKSLGFQIKFMWKTHKLTVC